jgi:hypothetical protein
MTKIKIHAQDRSGCSEHQTFEEPQAYIDCYLSGQIDEKDWQTILNERPDVHNLYVQRTAKNEKQRLRDRILRTLDNFATIEVNLGSEAARNDVADKILHEIYNKN